MRDITIQPAAARDLDEQADYFLRESFDLAWRYGLAATQTFRTIAANPGIGRPRDVRRPALAGLRSYPVQGFPSHLVFYFSTDRGIVIVRVLHGARDLDAAFEP